MCSFCLILREFRELGLAIHLSGFSGRAEMARRKAGWEGGVTSARLHAPLFHRIMEFSPTN